MKGKIFNCHVCKEQNEHNLSEENDSPICPDCSYNYEISKKLQIFYQNGACMKSTQNIVNLKEYKLLKNTSRRLVKSDFVEKIRLELKEKIKKEKINCASFIIFDDFIIKKNEH